MSRIRIGLAAAVAGSALLVPAAVHATASKTILKGTVGPGFTIKLTDASGHKVTKLKPGVYLFKVADNASIHNFVLERESGGTFEKAITSVGFVGTKTAVVTLKKGKWKFYCKPHESSMNGTFTVG
jgi:plastocyanin